MIYYSVIFSTLLILLTLFSCQVRTMSDDELNALYDSIPSIRIYQMEYRDVSRGKTRYHASAESAEMFDTDDKNKIVIHNMEFQQYDNDEKVSATGKAGQAVRFNATGNVEISKTIHIYSEKEKVTIESEYLLWQDNDKVLSGNISDEVRLIKKDGTFFSGKGFYVDSRKNRAEFRNGVYGKYISTSKSEDAQDSKPEEAAEIEEETLEEIPVEEALDE